MEALRGATVEMKDGIEVHKRGDTPFAQLEVRRDHMYLDLWLADHKLEEARASGIARAHPFMENEAVRVRFERAEDLTRVAHWLEESYLYAAVRARRRARAEKKKAAKTAPASHQGAKKAPAKSVKRSAPKKVTARAGAKH